jgi:hypothetical protein
VADGGRQPSSCSSRRPPAHGDGARRHACGSLADGLLRRGPGRFAAPAAVDLRRQLARRRPP